MNRRSSIVVVLVILLTACGSGVAPESRVDDSGALIADSSSRPAAFAMAGSFESAAYARDANEQTAQRGPVKSKLSDKCLDASGGIGSLLTVRNCDGTADQLFELTTWGQLRVKDLCVGYSARREGAGVVLEPCKASWSGASQGLLWAYDAHNALASDVYACIDIAGGDRNDGARVVLWTCHGGDNQAWLWSAAVVAESPAGGRRLGPDYIIATMPDGDIDVVEPRCLDTQTRTPGINAKLVSFRCHGGDSQQFRFDPGAGTTDGTIRLFGYCLDGRLGHGRAVIFDHCSGSKTQRWYTDHLPGLDVGDNLANNSVYSGQIQNRETGLCIDIEGAKTELNTPVINWTCSTIGWERTRGWNQVFGVGTMGYAGEAIVIQRKAPPPPDLGHTGWAIELPDGRWLGGAWDGVTPWGLTPKGSYNGHWKRVFATKQDVLAYFAKNDSYMSYDWYKEKFIHGVNTAAAFSLEAQSWDWGYGVFGNNCLDQSIELLDAYGWWDLPSRWNEQGQFRTPNRWFEQVGPRGFGNDLPGRRTSAPSV